MGSAFLMTAKSTLHNPDPADLRQFVAEMPNARPTEYGHYNINTKVVSRSKGSTFIVDDDAKRHSDPCITRSEYDRIAKLQDEHIRSRAMIVLDGYIGCRPQTRTPVRLYIEKSNANIAAMQQQLYFTPSAAELAHFEPRLNVIYTPTLEAKGYPNDRLVAVNLGLGITRVFNSDYFGESKKGGLRMWNQLIHERGGLAMHAGCKEIPVGSQRKIALIIGLSGTGKTTTTFTRQNGSLPVQDDFIAWLPDGSVIGSENGCFAKTFGLSRESEPMIYHAVTQRAAYLENVSVASDGRVDFFDKSFTENGRATFPLALIPEVGNVENIPRVDFVLILNRNETLIPAVARLTRDQAAAYFMLGETKGTSAGGIEEAGKALRVPGTNPFFPGLHAQQGMRFLELLTRHPANVYLMNTGWVGGPDGTPHSRKVKIRHSSAVVKAIAENSIEWMRDPDFGYEIAARVPDFAADDELLLRPKDYYGRTDRATEYQKLVTQLKEKRAAHLSKFAGLDDRIVQAVR